MIFFQESFMYSFSTNLHLSDDNFFLTKKKGAAKGHYLKISLKKETYTKRETNSQNLLEIAKPIIRHTKSILNMVLI